MTYDEARTPEGFVAAKQKIETAFNSFLVEQDTPQILGGVLDYWGVRQALFLNVIFVLCEP